MTYASGSSILAADYNIFVQGGASGVNHAIANVNSIWGTGTGDKGWGQSGLLTTVSPGGPILATQWTTLTSRVNLIKRHTTGTAYTISNGPAIVPGAIITAVTNLPTTIDTAYTNRFTCSNYAKEYTNTYYQSGYYSWHSYYRHTITYTFPGSDSEKIRYFFNTGGRLSLTFDNTSATGDGGIWKTLAGQCGRVYLNATSTTQTGWLGGNAATIASSTGYHQLTTSDTQIFRQDGTTADNYYIKVNAKISGYTVILTVEFRDADSSVITREGEPLTATKIQSPGGGDVGEEVTPIWLPTVSWTNPTSSVVYTRS